MNESSGLFFHPGIEKLISYFSDQDKKRHQDEHREHQWRRQGEEAE